MMSICEIVELKAIIGMWDPKQMLTGSESMLYHLFVFLDAISHSLSFLPLYVNGAVSIKHYNLHMSLDIAYKNVEILTFPVYPIL